VPGLAPSCLAGVFPWGGFGHTDHRRLRWAVVKAKVRVSRSAVGVYTEVSFLLPLWLLPPLPVEEVAVVGSMVGSRAVFVFGSREQERAGLDF